MLDFVLRFLKALNKMVTQKCCFVHYIIHLALQPLQVLNKALIRQSDFCHGLKKQKIMRKIIWFSAFYITCLASIAQTGKVMGVIKETGTNETIPFANVLVKGTPYGVVTDMDGKYELKLKPGKYDIVYMFLGYEEVVKQDVVLADGQTVIINVSLTPATFKLDDVVVTSTRVTNTEMAVMIEMRKSEQIVSGISNQQIRRSPDNDASQVVRRIPGISISADNFLVVRGLAARYNNVLLNGVIAPSVEADSRSFAFDLIPSALLDRMMVYKSGAADIPGDFAGALVRIYTKNTVAENFDNVRLFTGMRNRTTFQDFRTSDRQPLDIVGFGQVNRQLPSGFPSDLRQYSFQPDFLVNQAKQFDNSWGSETKMALPDLRLMYEMGRKFEINGKEVTTLNTIAYSNVNLVQDVERFRYTGYDEAGRSVPFFTYSDNRNVNTVRVSAMSNWSYKPNQNTLYEFRNFFVQTGALESTFRTGVNQNRNVEEQNYSYRYASRGIYSGQLQGTHTLNDGRASITWIGGLTASNAQEPDWRRAQSRRIIGSEDDFQIIIPNNANTQNAARFFTNLKERAVSGVVDYEYIINSETNTKIKTGVFSEYKWRSFAARNIGYIRSSTTLDPAIEMSPIETIFSPENMFFPNGLMIGENTKFTDIYNAYNINASPYISASTRIFKKINLAGGVRYEFNIQNLETAPSPAGIPEVANLTGNNILPFANASYNLTDNSLVRASFGITINRPEFRELAPFSYYNFDLTADIVGNPNLQNATIYNYDIRYEIYPSASETFSFGIFYKKFINPIEFIITTGADNPVFISQNADQANAYGAEVEFRRSLSFISERLTPFSFVFNASYIRSEIDLGSSGTLTQARVRPLQGQSPYIVNTGIYYNTKKGAQFTALYNVSGPRIFLVGDNEFPTQYEMPRHMIDLTYTQPLSKKIEFKVGVTDLLNTVFEVREDGNLDGMLNNSEVDNPIILTRFGQYIQAGLTFKL